MLTAIHPKRRVAKVLQAHYGGLHKTLKGDKMKAIMRKLDLDEFEVVVLGLIAVSALSIFVEMYIGMFR